MTYYDNPLDELKGKTVDAYEMAVKIYEMSKKLKNEDTINGLGYATALLFEMATKALEQEPCDDAVSRQIVKEQMLKYGFHAPDMTVTEFVEDLPSATPKREENTVSEERYTEEYTRRKALEYENYVLKQNMQALKCGNEVK